TFGLNRATFYEHLELFVLFRAKKDLPQNFPFCDRPFCLGDQAEGLIRPAAHGLQTSIPSGLRHRQKIFLSLLTFPWGSI
ncbi:hypothetical protein, partial [Intestinimonas butyriciproducens]|uniref:hypothetical protein n=1 Tax=Intestinimonas butyriciproducens TaxID=1297617 RepID=UPI00195C7BFB